MRALALRLSLCASLLTAAHVARADEPEPERRWYGWQTLSVDAAAAAAMLQGTRTGAKWMQVAGVAAYAAGGPVVHVAHGQPGRAAISLGTRLALPFGAGLALSRASKDSLVGVVAGLYLGILGAIAIDAAALGWEEVPRGTPATASSSAPLGVTVGGVF